MKTRTKIQRSMKKEPRLTHFGLGLPHNIKISDRRKEMKEEKRRLMNSNEQFEAACEWLEGIEKTELINTRQTSYCLKHITERRAGIGPISNGVLIAAAIHCGFNYKISRSYPNVFFNMSQDSIQQKYEESLLYQKDPLQALALVH